jgi:hypothetical protein
LRQHVARRQGADLDAALVEGDLIACVEGGQPVPEIVNAVGILDRIIDQRQLVRTARERDDVFAGASSAAGRI